MPQQPFEFFNDTVWMSDALRAGNTGLWKIYITPDTGQGQMFANETMLMLLGLDKHPSPEECYEWWISRVDPEYLDMVTSSVGRSFTTGEHVEVEYPWMHPLLGQIFVRCGGKPVLSSLSGGQLQMMGYHQNITELQLVRESLQESLSGLEMACRVGKLGVFELLPEAGGTFLLKGNAIFSQHFAVEGTIPAQEIWDTIESRLPENDQKLWRQLPHWPHWHSGSRISVEVPYAHPQREHCWLAIACEYFSKPGTLLRAVGYVTDITAQKMHEEALLKSKETAEAASLSKSTFLAHMSHEIRTPMNAVINMAHLVLKTPLSPKQKDYVSKISSSSKLMLHILNDILDFSKIEANKMEVEQRIFEMGSELETLLTLVQQWAEQKGLAFVSEIDPDIPRYLKGDDLRLRQILVNLSSNAIKFTAKGQIELHASLLSHSETSARIAFWVRDFGIGICEEDQAKLFRPFTQGDSTTTRRFGGTGLGLAISSMLAELMGGTISVTSRLGYGSTFRVELPFGIPKEEECLATQSPIEVHSRSDFTGLRALIVEDNEINQEILVALLEELGVRSEIASNGAEAVDVFSKDQAFDCIFMDVQMPIMDGYTATRAIRASGLPHARSMPIIAMTAHAMRGDADKSLASGMSAHLTKPIDVKELAHALETWACSQRKMPHVLE